MTNLPASSSCSTTRARLARLGAVALPACLLAVALSGCASAPPPVFITLPSAAAPASGANAVPDGNPAHVLIVRRVRVPEYLDVSAVRYRAAESALGEWPNTTWAERPAVALTRELAARLRVALPGWTVCDGTCSAGLSGQVVQAEWAPLDYVRERHELQAELRYTLSSLDTSTAPRSITQRVTVPVSPDTAAGQASAMAAVVDAAAQAIAANVR